MNNSGGIFLAGWHGTGSAAPNQLNYLDWNNLITNNDTTGSGAPSFIFVGGTQNYGTNGDGPLSGLLAMDNEVRGNAINSHNLGGYYNYIYEGGGPSFDQSGIGVVGSIFERNTATNLPVKPYVSLGTSQNTFHYAGEPATMPCLNLQLTDRSAGNMTIPGVQVNYPVHGTERPAARTENWPSAASGMIVLNDPALVGSQAGYATQYPTVFRDSGSYDVWIKAPGYLASSTPSATPSNNVRHPLACLHSGATVIRTTR